LSETFFSTIRNEKVIWSGTLKWGTLYIHIYTFMQNISKNYLSFFIDAVLL